MNLSAVLLRFRSGSKLIWRSLATCFFSLSHPCLGISPNEHAHGKHAISRTPRSIWPFERRRRWAACNRLRVYFRGPSPSLFEQNPFIKDRFSADFNGRRDLRIWVGEMAQSEEYFLEIYTYIFYTSCNYFYTLYNISILYGHLWRVYYYHVNDYDCVYRGSILRCMIGFLIETEKQPRLGSKWKSTKGEKNEDTTWLFAKRNSWRRRGRIRSDHRWRCRRGWLPW